MGRFALRVGWTLFLTLVVTATTRGQDWEPLFDGVSLHGWTDATGQTVLGPAWEVVDGTLHLDHAKGSGGNLLSMREWGDFELTFEWKVAPGANNGIKYRVQDFAGQLLGIEYQVIDDARHPQLSASHKTASVYDIYDAKSHDVLRPAGQFNRSRIVVKQEKIQHWLNGHLVAEAVVGSPEWESRIASSKFADVDGFGRNRFGKIMITDHHDEVWYRNIFIRDLTHGVSSDDLASSKRQRRGTARFRWWSLRCR